jgi:hypothetical protein
MQSSEETCLGNESPKALLMMVHTPTILNEITLEQQLISELLALWTLPIVRNYKYQKTAFRKVDLFPSSVEGRETPALLGPLERTNLNHWTSY